MISRINPRIDPLIVPALHPRHALGTETVQEISKDAIQREILRAFTRLRCLQACRCISLPRVGTQFISVQASQLVGRGHSDGDVTSRYDRSGTDETFARRSRGSRIRFFMEISKHDTALALFLAALAMFGITQSNFLGSLFLFVILLIYRHEIAARAREIAIGCVIVLCVVPISYVVWTIVNKPGIGDARKVPFPPPTYPDPPKATPLSQTNHLLELLPQRQ